MRLEIRELWTHQVSFIHFLLMWFHACKRSVMERARMLGSRWEQVRVAYVLHMFEFKVLKILQVWVWAFKRWMQTSCTLVRIVVCQRHWNGHGSCRSCRQGLQAPLAAQSSITEIWFVRCEWNLTWHHTHMASLDMHATYVLCVMSSLLWNWLQTCVNRLMYPCTSECNLAGSPSIRCSADFPLHWHPGSIFKILHSASCITPYYPLQSGRIVHACNESVCAGTAIGVYSVCECWDWILQWDRKIGGVSCWVLLILMMAETIWLLDP